jgi:hypothetical protein
MSSYPVAPRKAQSRLLLLKPGLDSTSRLIALAGIKTESNSNTKSGESYPFYHSAVETAAYSQTFVLASEGQARSRGI